MYFVSACLVGENCRYDGNNSYSKRVTEFLSDKEYIAMCPEELGGLTTPRAPSSFIGGTGEDVLLGSAKIIDADKKERTREFIKGAERSLSAIRERGITHAILKERSPSCGVREVYLKGKRVEGMGVTAALFTRESIVILSDEEI
ncbi:MAG: DUF523 domain-containing protein [Deltaproteobacteria bacterium]|uniref:DUF523 domain-containing protein n=1 Tax=Candidatus Zymogenus saltonus TaxID=2844893 RepID=A0A9D8KDI6_9DELT|nr:DUF523 domain-containing protein [Candidatus Zymogenus saltonus]